MGIAIVLSGYINFVPIVFIAACMAILFTPLLLLGSGSRLHGGSFLSIISFGILVFSTYQNGGLGFPSVIWLCVVPLIAQYAIGPRASAFFTLLVGVSIFFFFVGHQSDWKFPAYVPEKYFGSMQLTVLLSLLFFIFLLGRFSELFLKQLSQERERLELLLNQKKRLESLGTLSAGIAHDFNNMLWIILGNTERALRKVSEDDPTYSMLEQIRNASNRAQKRVEQLLTFARGAEIVLKPLDLSQVVEEVQTLIEPVLPKYIKFRVICRPKEGAFLVLGDRNEMVHLLFLLITNSVDAIPKTGGMISIVLEPLGVSRNSYAGSGQNGFVLKVIDTGEGISPEIQGRIMEPFFTTKAVGEGTGLGLSMCHGIVHQMNGVLDIKSEVGSGTTIEMVFPRYGEVAFPAAENYSASTKQ